MDQAATTRIILKIVDEGFAPIIQAPDVAVNKVFKSGVKQRYHNYQAGLPINIGQKLSAARETVVDFVLDAIAEKNRQNDERKIIMDAFKRCGLNPRSKKTRLEYFRNI
jgi:hypothetical protein